MLQLYTHVAHMLRNCDAKDIMQNFSMKAADTAARIRLGTSMHGINHGIWRALQNNNERRHAAYASAWASLLAYVRC